MLSRITVAGLAGAALLAVGCTESVGPEHHAPQGPLFQTTAASAGITLDQQNGALGSFPPPGTTIIKKGFNPVNPHRGDAIVATFFWVGSSTITGVSDHETNGGPVGNRYQFVESVTAGGLSMATYVATNVQNFPDAFNEQNTPGDSILVVEAAFSLPITEGGVLISAWTGVDPDFTRAFTGVKSSASGSGSSPLPVAPGPINVGAGALAYGVALVNALAGADPPQGFLRVHFQNDGPTNRSNDGVYAVPTTAGSVNPQWTWFFSSPASSTWLATVLALNPPTTQPPPVANFTFNCTSLVCNLDASSSTAQPSATYSWNWGDATPAGSGKTATHVYGAAGTYSVTLTVTDGGGSSSTTQPVTVSVPPVADFTFSCSALACSFDASSSTAQATATYSWDWGDATPAGSGKTATHTFGTGGTYNVTLTVTDAGGSSSTTKSLAVTVPNRPPIVNAGPNGTAVTGLFYTLRASFSDPDDNGPWSYTIDWGDGSTSTGTVASQGAITGEHTYLVVLPRNFTIRVTVVDNEGAAGSDAKVVTVLLL